MEETGNLLVILATLAQKQALDVSYLEPYIPLLNIWGTYLNASLPDPGDQLCTDDFEVCLLHIIVFALVPLHGDA